MTLLPPCTWGPSDYQTCRLPQSGPILGPDNSVPPCTPAHSQVHGYLPPSQGPGEGVGLGLEGLKFFLGSPASLPAESALGAGQQLLPNLRYVLEGCLRGLHQGGGGGALPLRTQLFPGPQPPLAPDGAGALMVEAEAGCSRPQFFLHKGALLSPLP